MKRTKALLLSFLLCAAAKATPTFLENNPQPQETQAAIVSIPDPQFKFWLVSSGFNNVDTNHDGEVQVTEAQAVKKIKINSCVNNTSFCVSDLTGLEAFTALESFDCASQKIPKIDLSHCPNLTYLNLGDNPLTSLDVTKNTKLTFLSFSSAQFSAIDLSKNTALVSLSISRSPLKNLDLTANPNLFTVHVTECAQLDSICVTPTQYANVFTSLGGWSTSAPTHFTICSTAPCVPIVRSPNDHFYATTATLDTLVIGKALYFDGVNDYIKVPSFFKSEGPFTIEYWAKPLELPSRFNFPALKSIVNQWNHIAVTCTGKNGKLGIYVNGVLKVSGTLPGSSIVALNSFLIGNFGTDYYHGYLHDFRIWNKVLTVTQLQANLYTFDDYKNPSLLGAWKLNEGEGTVAKDYATHKNDGTFSGCVWANVDDTYLYEWRSGVSFAPTQLGRTYVFRSFDPAEVLFTIVSTDPKGCKATQYVTVTVSNPSVSTREEESPEEVTSDEIRLFPNPTTGATFLQFPASSESIAIKLMDLSGKVIQSFAAASGQIELPTEGLQTGVYYVSFQWKGKNITKKLQVIH